MIKLILKTYITKRNINGNTYCAAEAVNVKTRKSFIFKTYSEGNALHALKKLLNLKWDEIWTISKSTGSARISSLPEAKKLSSKEFAEECRNIGFFVPKTRIKKEQNFCL